MDRHETQRQHRVPEIYLKQFGFKEEQDWYVTLLDKTKNCIADTPIKKFTVTINEFDYPSDNYVERKHFEQTASIVEGMYPTVLNTIKHQNKLISKHEDVLRHLIASLICRSELSRNFFSELLSDKDMRNKFIEEVAMFDEKEISPLKIATRLLEPKLHLPLITGILTNHLVRVLRSFSSVILKDYEGRGWFTSDNPVCIDFQDNFSWIIPIEAEIYFPLSLDYCLFMYHEKSEKNSNPLRKFEKNKVHSLDELLHDTVVKKILSHPCNSIEIQ